MMSKNFKLVADEEIPDGVIIPDETWAIKFDDVTFYIKQVAFADKENDDGTYDMNIDYEILDGEVEDIDEFNNLLGEFVIEALTEQLSKEENN